MQNDKTKAEFIKVYTTYKMSDVAFIKSLFITGGIPYFVTNENLHTLYGAADGFTAMDIIVPRDKAEEAKNLLKDFTESKRE